MPGYLENLTLRLANGLAAVPEEVRELHSRYLLTAQRPDGGFAGREGGSDLYYTGFALRSLALLGELYGEPAQRAAGFLRSRLGGQESIVDFFSLLYGAALLENAAGIRLFADSPPQWPDNVAQLLESFRRPDGGYAKGPEGAAGSTYHTFLVLLSLELIDRRPPEPARIVTFLQSQRSEDGGFREIRASKRAGSNPTAAAIAALQMLESLDEATRLDTIDFLAEMQTDEGGLRANTRIPIADLLSTFTGVLTLQDLQGLAAIEPATVARFVHSLAREEGGFHGAAWDGAHDVEYTFYGLGCLSLLAAG